MVPCLRLFLMIGLIVLQCVAPLVHAHIGGNAEMAGLHLHEFEQVKTGSKQNVPSYTAGHQWADSSQVVVIDLAMKLRTDQWMPVGLIDAKSGFSAWDRPAVFEIIHYQHRHDSLVQSYFYQVPSSRAPPLPL
jgi:hypothetical protein